MTFTLLTLLIILGAWMLACAWCGYHVMLVRFAGVLLGGLALNMAWMMMALNAKPLEDDALMALAAAVIYALSAFGCGWLAGRMARRFRDTRVDVDGV